MAAKTSLLLLLDGILSQADDQIRDALTQIMDNIERNEAVVSPQAKTIVMSFDPAAVGVGGSLSNLPDVVRVLLEADPQTASTPSDLDGSLPLHFAASLGDVRVASILIAKYPRATSTPNNKGKLALHYAAREGRDEMVSYLLRVDPATARMDSCKNKLPLHFAAGEGYVHVVRHLLHAYPEGASVPSSKGKMPLHFAARWGHIQIAKDLLALYPDGVKALDWEGSLPLHDAAREGQTAMAELLVERYCQGLSTANLRGEIPLFPAVRSNNVELVVSLLQAWPRGGKQILASASADDNVENWDNNILELCLRGAVGNFYNCSIGGRKLAPALCHCGQVFTSSSRQHVNGDNASDGPCQCHSENKLKVVGVGENSVRAYAAGDTYAPHVLDEKKPSADERVVPDVAHLPDDSLVLIRRSKSPILELKTSKKRGLSTDSGGKKRLRSGSLSGTSSVALRLQELPREFYHLHAAIECGATSHVLRCVLQRHASLVTKVDCFGQLPLHIAAAHSRDPEVIDVVLEEILRVYPQATYIRNHFRQLPLHVALCSNADFRLIEALVKANPSSGFERCRTNDKFIDSLPLQMATESGCDLSTTYLLLRGDPNFVQKFVG